MLKLQYLGHLMWRADSLEKTPMLGKIEDGGEGSGRLEIVRLHHWLNGHQFSSVAQSCPTLCDLMNCSTPGLPVHHQLPESTQTHVHWVGDAIQPSYPLSSPSPPALNLSQHQSLFKWVSSSHQVAKILSKFLEIVKDRGAWHAAVYGVAKGPKWLINWTTTKHLLISVCSSILVFLVLHCWTEYTVNWIYPQRLYLISSSFSPATEDFDNASWCEIA